MRQNIDFTPYIGKPYQEVVVELSKAYPEFDVGELRTDWFTTADYREDRINVYFTPESDAVTNIDIG
jgi:hypothetical protein